MKNWVVRGLALATLAGAFASVAEPMREWDWHMPGDVYKNLEFSDRAGVDRAVKLFEQAIDAERRGVKVTDLVPRYRTAANEWRKVQVQGEAEDSNSPLLAYAVFMQGYAFQQARDRNKAIARYNEVLDLYPDQKYIAVPARYMLSRVKREMGDVKQADADLDEIIEDREADGHKIFYNVLRDRAGAYWRKDQVDDAAELWAKIVFSKGKPDWNLWSWSRNDLILARLVGGDFANLESAVLAGQEDAKKKRDAVAANAQWVSEIDRYGHHAVTQYLDGKYPKEKKASERKAQLEKLRKGYAAWLDGEAHLFDGAADGWQFALAQLRAHAAIEKPDQVTKRVKGLEALVKNAAPDAVDGRARTLAFELVALGQKDAARACSDFAKNTLYRLRLKYDLEMQMGEWKAAAMYLEEYVGQKPPPPVEELKRAKYDLAWLYRVRLGKPDAAVKIYQDLDDPPRAIWGLAEALRECGKKDQSYATLKELSIFPNEAPNAVLRAAQWRENDGEKEKAIALYRGLLKHPKWKETSASSQAHQALERYGILTGGAMTNEVH